MEGDHLKPSIGFIGMGHMGSHMVQRLLDAGYQLTVYDRTEEKPRRWEQRGAQVAQTPRDLAANCQVVMACVRNDEAQHEVMFGPDGALAGVHGWLGHHRPEYGFSRRLTPSLPGGEGEKCCHDRCCRLGQCATGGSGQPGDLRRRRARDLSAVQTYLGRPGPKQLLYGRKRHGDHDEAGGQYPAWPGDASPGRSDCAG